MDWVKMAISVFVGTLTAFAVVVLALFLFVGATLNDVADELESDPTYTVDPDLTFPEDEFTTEP